MTHRRSVSRRLIRGLGFVALGGTTLLLIVVAMLYRVTFARFAAGEATERAFNEMLDHVALPVLILMAPMAFVALRVIRQAFAPLADAAVQIEAARGRERGFRIDTSHMPSEALPFTDAVNDLLGRLDEAAMRQEAFAADVAHELRTPLAVLSLELDRLDHADAVRLKADVAAMRRLIDQLMLLAQIDAGAAAQIAPEDVPLADVVTDVVSFMAPGIIEAGRAIALESGDAAPVVRGRREAIAAALRNLIENAVRVTPPGGTVHVGIDDPAAIMVRDEGPGLTPERLNEMVRRHSRADHASKDGAGLGLAIVDRIMAAHGGHLGTDPVRRTLCLRFSGG